MAAILSQGPIFLLSLVFMLGVVVIIHELGHYIAGRVFGAAVESFSVGFGRPIYQRVDKRGTRWRINWIPLGGFVKFVGESQLPGDVGKLESGLVGKPYYQVGVGARSIVSVAGPLANFVLAVGLFALIFMFNGVPDKNNPDNRVTLASVQESSPAEVAGLIAGDVLVSIKGRPIYTATDAKLSVMFATGEELPITVNRSGELHELFVTPIRVVRENDLGQKVPQGTMGVGLVQSISFRSVNPGEAIVLGVHKTGEVFTLTTTMLGRMVTGKEPINSLSGPVAIGDAGRRLFNMTVGNENISFWDGVQAFMWNMVSICAAVSIGIGFFNLLPFPVLDGGHLVFNAYEAVTGKMMPEKVQEVALMAGLCLLLTMFVFITWGDILETGLFNRSAG